MARPKKLESERKVKLTTRIDPTLYAWLQTQIGVGQRWSDITHALEFCVARLREAEEGSASRASRTARSEK